jgi:hypothetical protein
MATPNRPMGLPAAVRGVAYVAFLGLAVVAVGALVAALLVWVMA